MRASVLLFCTLLVAACSGGDESSTNETDSATGEEAAASADAAPSEAETTPSESQSEAGGDASTSVEDMTLPQTAWRATGEDGAIYTTFFDPDGVYRDMKNGELWGDGTWERLPDGRVCFTPAEEGRSGDCWSLGRETRDGTMRVTRDDGREVELLRVTYIAPLETADS